MCVHTPHHPGENVHLFDYIRSKHPVDRENKRPWELSKDMWFPKLNSGTYIVVFRKDMTPEQVESLVETLSRNHGIAPKHVYKVGRRHIRFCQSIGQ
jgi:hypothetical protein